MEIFYTVLFFKELYLIFIHLWQKIANWMPPRCLLKPMCTEIMLLVPVPFSGHCWLCRNYPFLHAWHTCQEFCLKQNHLVLVFFLFFPWQAFPNFLLMISIDLTLITLIYSFLPCFKRKDFSFLTVWIIPKRMNVLLCM